ncbi:SET-binding factor 2 [Cichlidogyrus casuarinus]|uniref:SET-binding factor 2 n=1 Tax=Cichlidogyrus casuarinus TaxID=1844966 RepID=A0ABD2QHC0_9PLAT
MPAGWDTSRSPLPPSFFVAHLTSIENERYYAACCTFYEGKQDSIEPRKVFAYSPRPPSSRCSSIDSNLPLRISNNDDEIVPPPEQYVPKCLVLIARHSHFDLLKNCLSLVYTLFSNSDNRVSIELLLANIIGSVQIPPTGGQLLSFSLGAGDTQYVQPAKWPSIPVTKCTVANLFRYLGIHNVLTIFCAVIRDAKVVFCSRSLNRLTESCSALCSLLYPLRYEYPFVPTLSRSLIDYCDSPTPFLYGIHSSCVDLIPDIESIFLADLDCGSVRSPLPEKGGTAPQLPQPYLNFALDNLYKILSPDLLVADQMYPVSISEEPVRPKKIATLDAGLTGKVQSPLEASPWKDKLLRAVFSKLFAQLFTGYRSCLYITRIHPQPIIYFDDALFLMLRKIHSRNEFFKGLLASSRFHSFIQERGAPYRVCDLFDDTYHTIHQSPQHTCEGDETRVPLSVEQIANCLFENEYPASHGVAAHVLPDQAEQAHQRIHLTPFPELNEALFRQELNKCLEKQKRKQEMVYSKPEPRFVPMGQSLDRQLFRTELNTDKHRVIRGFVHDIFSHHITEALKRRNTVRQDLRLRPFRRIFIDELYDRIILGSCHDDLQMAEHPEARAILSWDQFELILDLLDEALKHEAQSENTGIHAPVMELCSKLCTVSEYWQIG